jgi:hypothetical protein
MNGRKTVATLTLLLLALALVPAALATRGSGVRPDDRAGIRGPSSTPALAGSSGHARPDDRAGIRGPATAPVPLVSSPAPVIIRTRSGGFSWTSAGIGVAAGAAFVLLALGAGSLLRHNRTELRPA